MKLFAYTHFTFLSMFISIHCVYASQANSSSASNSSSTSSISTRAMQASQTPNTSPCTARQLFELVQSQYSPGSAEDKKFAAELYQQAVQLGGGPGGLLQLGYCYALGQGVSTDFTLGLKLLKQGAAAVHEKFVARTPILPQVKKLSLIKLPCQHYLRQSDLDQALQGRAEGQLPRCPACHQPFKTDQIISSSL